MGDLALAGMAQARGTTLGTQIGMTLPDLVSCLSMIFSENRYTLFGIML
jgi:hypothetical protein